MRPEELSRELRTGRGRRLARRRGIVGLSLAAAGSMGVIALYQMGILRRLPEPSLPLVDGEKVDASEEAYEKLSTPDALLGFGSYAVTAALAGMDGENRPTRRPWVPLAMTAKVLFDIAQATKLTRDQWVKHRAFCLWCLGATAATYAMLPLAVPEAREALERLTSRPLARMASLPRRLRETSALAD